MKTILICISIAAIAAVSCSKDQPEQEGTYSINAALSAVSSQAEWTKSHISFDNEPFQPVWDAGDEVAVVTERFPEGLTFTLAEGAGTPSGRFSSTSALNDTTSYLAIYPASAVSGSSFSSGGDIVEVEFPSRLSFNAETGCCDTDNFMAASGRDRNFEFKNIHSYLELTVSGPSGDALKSLSIKGKNGETVAGKARVTFRGGEPSVEFVSGQKEVTVDFGSEGLGFGEDILLDIALPPVLSNGFVVTVTALSGKTVTVRSSESSPSMCQNMILSMEEPVEVR